MRRLAALAALAAAVLAVPGSAAAGGPPTGQPCEFTSAGGVAGDVYNAVLVGGPVVAAGETVSLTCSVHVGNDRHDGLVAASVTGPALPGASVLAPTAVSYRAAELDTVVLCSAATAGTTTWYWDGTAWSPDSGSSCPPVPRLRERLGPVVSALPDALEPYAWYAVCMAWPDFIREQRTTCDSGFVFEDLAAVVESADHAACPFVALLSPGVPGVVEVREDGDVYVAGELVWDCPPYGVWGG